MPRRKLAWAAWNYEAADGRPVYLPIEPADALVEAVRRGHELGLPVHLVDRDVDQYPAIRDRLPDALAAESAGARSYLATALAAVEHSPRVAEDDLREQTMAFHIAALARDQAPGALVLVVCGLHHARGVVRQLFQILGERQPPATPLRRVRRDHATLHHLAESASREVLAELPFVNAAYERSRGTAPPSVLLIDSHSSQPLGVLSREINKRSNNFMAEQVLKSLGSDASGKPGSWQKGLQAVSRYLETLGIAPGKYQMVNGSGLFDSNRFTPTQVVVLLRAAYRDFRFAADFVASLALAGADGTIGHRMSGSVAERYVRAKTGTLSGISCLSGYAGAPAPGSQPLRPPLAFAVLVNDLGEDGGVQPAKRLQDAVVEALVTYLSVSPSSPGAALK